MCFFFLLHQLTTTHPYFRGVCNQFTLRLILKSKYQLLISDNSVGSSTSVFSSTIFSKIAKNAIFKGLEPSYLYKRNNGF